MRLKAEQLPGALQKNLAAVYFISGEEPLQLAEATDGVRHVARKQGYENREIINIDHGNEWGQFAMEADSMSIFADKKLIDLRLPSAKPGQEGGKALQAYCQNPPPDTILLISAGKLESNAQKSQWLQAIDKIGVVVQVWPLQGAELSNWLQKRAENKGMRLEADALKLLVSRIEGNLLAAAQEIEKLYIRFGKAHVSKAMVEADVADSSRFDVFKLVDALLQGKLNRAVKVLNGLKAEGLAAPVIVWAISRELRSLYQLQTEQKSGDQPSAARPGHYQDKHKQLQLQALQRLTNQDLQNHIKQCCAIDLQIKGQAAGDCWESLFGLCVRFCLPEQ